MPKDRVSRRVAIASALAFCLYIALTSITSWPRLTQISGIEQFALAKHLVVLAILAALMWVNPKIWSLIAVAWGAIVPFGDYRLLANELTAGTLGNLAALDTAYIVRVVLLFLGTCLAAVAAALHFAGGARALSTSAATDA